MCACSLLFGCFAADPHSATEALLPSGIHCPKPGEASDNATTDARCVAWWSVLNMLTISHVRSGDLRLLGPAFAALLFALAYVYEQTLEYRAFVHAKHAWLRRDGVEHSAVLMHAEGASVVGADELYAELVRVIGDGEIISVAPVGELRAGQRGEGWLEHRSLQVRS